MTVSCFPATEAQTRQIARRLKQLGLDDQYAEHAHGATIVISVHTRSFMELETVKVVLREAGIEEFFYADESIA